MVAFSLCIFTIHDMLSALRTVNERMSASSYCQVSDGRKEGDPVALILPLDGFTYDH